MRRGGSWSHDASYSASSSRVYDSPSKDDRNFLGFRIVRTLMDVETEGTMCLGIGRLTPWNFTEGLVAHYTFDGNGIDDSGNDNDGVLHGVTSTTDRHGKVDGAYHFDGASSYIEVADSDSLREVGLAVTLSVWVRPEAMTSENGKSPYWISILCKGNDSGNNKNF